VTGGSLQLRLGERPDVTHQGQIQVIRTTVRNGRIVIDEPTTLPDGHEVELCVLNDDG
jgi:hypothetical protein